MVKKTVVSKTKMGKTPTFKHSHYTHGKKHWRPDATLVYEDLTKESAKFLLQAAAFLEKHYGPRCDELCPGCTCCQVWCCWDMLAATMA